MELKELTLEEKETSTSSSFWKKLFAETKGFEEPVIYKNFFEQPLITEEEVMRIMSNWTQQPYSQAVGGIDMTVKGESRDGYDQQLYNQTYSADKTIEGIYNALFGNKKASILVRSAEQYCDPLSKRIATFLQPLIKEFGLPNFRWTTALLIGNYNYTPFGVHFDAGDQRAIHTMIGKGKKKMWYWKRDKVEEVIKSKGLNSLRYYSESIIPDLLPHGDCHLIEENDCYFLPNHHYHIAYTEEFTIGLAIALDRIDQSNIVSSAIQGYLAETLQDGLQNSSELFQPENIDYMNNLKQTEDHLKKENWLTKGVKNEILKCESNQGMAFPPQAKNISLPTLDGHTIKINTPFQIRWQVDQDGLTLYVRGRVIPLAYEDPDEDKLTLLPVLKRLNEGEELSFSDIAKKLEQEMDLEDVNYLFKILYSYGGVLYE